MDSKFLPEDSPIYIISFEVPNGVESLNSFGLWLFKNLLFKRGMKVKYETTEKQWRKILGNIL